MRARKAVRTRTRTELMTAGCPRVYLCEECLTIAGASVRLVRLRLDAVQDAVNEVKCSRRRSGQELATMRKQAGQAMIDNAITFNTLLDATLRILPVFNSSSDSHTTTATVHTPKPIAHQLRRSDKEGYPFSR